MRTKLNYLRFVVVDILLLRWNSKWVLTEGIACFWTGGCGGGPLVFVSLGCRLTIGLEDGGSLGASLKTSFVGISENTADFELTLLELLLNDRGLSGEDFLGCCGGVKRGASFGIWPLGVVPEKKNFFNKYILSCLWWKNSYQADITCNNNVVWKKLLLNNSCTYSMLRHLLHSNSFLPCLLNYE